MPEFLENYWHKKPTILKIGFQNFTIDPISPRRACWFIDEEEVDSRFISNLDNKWEAEHGPFSRNKFGELTETHWQLVVQAANHWHQGANQLTEAFQQLPNWLFDDLMICSAPEGGVGPHIDQYTMCSSSRSR